MPQSGSCRPCLPSCHGDVSRLDFKVGFHVRKGFGAGGGVVVGGGRERERE